MRKQEGQGQGLAEFALILPIALFVILGVTVLFHLFAVLVTTHNAASEGGRVAQVWRPNPTSACRDEVVAAVQRTTPFLDASRGDEVQISAPCWTDPPDPSLPIPSGTLITVRVLVNWQPVFFATLFKDSWEPPTTIPLVAEIQVRHE